MTSEQYEQAFKLEGIFMPHIRRQRELRKSQKTPPPPLRLVHYTSAEAALRIIESKRIWMRNTTCMSDYREVQHGFNILQKFFSDPQKENHFKDALELCAPGAAKEAIGLFNQWFSNIQLSTFITSLSEQDDGEDLHGRLSMWRAFGGSTGRVAIVFNIPWRTNASFALNLTFSPVAYLTETEAEAVLFEVIENIRHECSYLRSIDRLTLVGYVFMMLMAGVTCVKHEGFREEREWRAIYSPTRNPSSLMEPSTVVVNGIPQIIYKIPLDDRVAPELADLDFARAFDRLIIGPSQFPSAMFQAFAVALRNIGVVDPEKRLVISGIPIRT